MRIMMLEHYAGSIYRGMEFRPYYMAREWVKMGHEVVIIAADYTHLRKSNPKISYDFEEELVDGITYVFVKTPEYHGNNVGRAKNIAAFIHKVSHNASMLSQKYRPEAVIASSTYPLDIYPAAKIAKKTKAGLFFEIHDLWPLTPMEMGNLPWWNPLILLLQAGENYAFKHSDKIISILPDADKYIKLRGYDVSKFVYVPNGVIPAEMEKTDSDAQQVQKLRQLREQGYFTVGYTGNHSQMNALEYFIEAASLMKDEKVKFVLVGKGNYKEELKKTADEKAADNVLFLDPVAKEDMGALLSQIDVAYMGLAKSGLFKYGVSPNKLFDYMLAKRPIIYAVEASNDPVSEAKCGITVPVGLPEEIVKAVRDLMKKPKPELNEMGERGREYVLKNHNYDTLAKLFADSLNI